MKFVFTHPTTYQARFAGGNVNGNELPLIAELSSDDMRGNTTVIARQDLGNEGFKTSLTELRATDLKRAHYVTANDVRIPYSSWAIPEPLATVLNVLAKNGVDTGDLRLVSQLEAQLVSGR